MWYTHAQKEREPHHRFNEEKKRPIDSCHFSPFRTEAVGSQCAVRTYYYAFWFKTQLRIKYSVGTYVVISKLGQQKTWPMELRLVRLSAQRQGLSSPSRWIYRDACMRSPRFEIWATPYATNSLNWGGPRPEPNLSWEGDGGLA